MSKEREMKKVRKRKERVCCLLEVSNAVNVLLL